MKKLFTLIFSVAVISNVQAQMSGCSVFLQGKYVELGIAPGGSYGAPHQPAGYHGNVTGGAYTPCADTGTYGLGFVADPDMDGWAVGTPPFYGDYFLPGSPFEGWSLQEGALNCDGYNTDASPGFTGAVSGANVSYNISGSTKSGTWQGVFDSLELTQVTSLDTNALFFTIKITITNTASVAKNNIYYLRTLDPDNDEAEGGSFTTNNAVVYQQPNAFNAAVVSADGETYTGAYLALGTADSNAKAFIYNSWPISSTIDISTILGETFSAEYTPGVGDPGDIAIGLALRIAHLAPADSASDSVGYRTTAAAHMHPANSYTFTCFYAFSRAAVDSAIQATRYVPDTTVTSTTGVTNVNNTSTIHIFPNPSKDVVNVTGLYADDLVLVYDMMGKRLNTNWQVKRPGTNTFPLSDIPAGIYLVVVKDSNGNLKSNTPFRKL